MTYYPKASAALSGAGAPTSASTTSAPNTAGVSASVKFPEIEERILKYWDEDGTFQASIDQRDSDLPGGKPGSATNSSSTTALPSPTACRTTATC